MQTPAPLTGGGSPLGADVRGEMEARFAYDFSGVRIHTGSEAAQSATAFASHAYTSGTDIVFGDGKFAPDTADGRRTLAHELTHVIQQSEGPVAGSEIGGGVAVSDPNDDFERAAERTADDVVSANPAQTGTAETRGTHAGVEPVQRDDDDKKPGIDLLPPKVDVPIGPIDVSADTSKAGLSYKAPGFGAGLGYNYGGDITANMKYGGVSGDLGVNPSTGAASLGASYDQFRLNANVNPNGGFGVGLGYGSPLLPFAGDIGKSVMGGEKGLEGAAGSLPGAMNNPLDWYKGQSGNIDAMKGAYGTLSGINDAKDNKNPFGAGLNLTSDPKTGTTLWAGAQYQF